MIALLLLLQAAPHCGIERWNVKTVSDAGAALIDTVPRVMTVARLRSWPAPIRPTTRLRVERQVVTLHVVVIGVKRETDEDDHIVVADPNDTVHTMIVEIPSADCTAHSRFREAIANARSVADSVLGPVHPKYHRFPKPIPATVTGVVFFDKLHGQTGVAVNGVELHPLVRFSSP